MFKIHVNGPPIKGDQYYNAIRMFPSTKKSFIAIWFCINIPTSFLNTLKSFNVDFSIKLV